VVYQFKNEKTGEIYELSMSYDEKSKYLEDNPDVRSYFGSMPGFISGTGLEGKMDEGWKENLSRIAEAQPQSALAEKQGGRSAKEAKKANILKKHGLDKKGSYNMGDM